MSEVPLPPGIHQMLEAMCGICLEERISHRQLSEALKTSFIKVYQRKLDTMMNTDPMPAAELEQLNVSPS